MTEISTVLGENTDAAFRALMECSPDFVGLATTHGELFYLNGTARRWIGLEENSPLATVTFHFYSDDSCASSATWPCRASTRPVNGKAAAVCKTSKRGSRRACKP